ncbi:hypothetical protein [Candidatus Desulfosporosinus nitrosoreducens]|uniref:hypothetical protein n=1 Tax=Candidatus Desulfosporosinus nitrosoreducens TaxID=3401928 RepID=UPI00280BE69B|nr:hypothetical protein [Desulfosporosinus sp. PR]
MPVFNPLPLEGRGFFVTNQASIGLVYKVVEKGIQREKRRFRFDGKECDSRVKKNCSAFGPPFVLEILGGLQ